jgi:hypothetical protein
MAVKSLKRMQVLKSIPFWSNNLFLSLLIGMNPVFNVNIRAAGRRDMGDKDS